MASDIIYRGMVQEWLPSLSVEAAISLASEASAALRVYAPCVNPDVDSDARTLAVGAMRRILQAAEIVPTGVRVETRGPLSTTYWARGNLLLSGADVAELQALCDRVDGTRVGGLPRGSFPAPPCWDGLFVDRRLGRRQ